MFWCLQGNCNTNILEGQSGAGRENRTPLSAAWKAGVSPRAYLHNLTLPTLRIDLERIWETTFNYTGCLKEITVLNLPYHAVHGLVFLTHYVSTLPSVTTVSASSFLSRTPLRFHRSCNLEVPVRQLVSHLLSYLLVLVTNAIKSGTR